MFTFVHRAQCFEMSPQSKLCLHFAATCLPTLVSCIREYKLTAVNFLIDVGIITRSLRSLGCCDTAPPPMSHTIDDNSKLTLNRLYCYHRLLFEIDSPNNLIR